MKFRIVSLDFFSSFLFYFGPHRFKTKSYPIYLEIYKNLQYFIKKEVILHYFAMQMLEILSLSLLLLEIIKVSQPVSHPNKLRHKHCHFRSSCKSKIKMNHGLYKLFERRGGSTLFRSTQRSLNQGEPSQLTQVRNLLVPVSLV